LAIIDWKMSRINGIEFAKIIPQLDNKIMVILVPGYGVDHDLRKQLKKQEYFEKVNSFSQVYRNYKKRAK
jgi:two-component SAPR family response regulator